MFRLAGLPGSDKTGDFVSIGVCLFQPISALYHNNLNILSYPPNPNAVIEAPINLLTPFESVVTVVRLRNTPN